MSALSFRNVYSVPALQQNKGSPETTQRAEIRRNAVKSHTTLFSPFSLVDE